MAHQPLRHLQLLRNHHRTKGRRLLHLHRRRCHDRTTRPLRPHAVCNPRLLRPAGRTRHGPGPTPHTHRDQLQGPHHKSRRQRLELHASALRCPRHLLVGWVGGRHWQHPDYLSWPTFDGRLHPRRRGNLRLFLLGRSHGRPHHRLYCSTQDQSPTRSALRRQRGRSDGRHHHLRALPRSQVGH